MENGKRQDPKPLWVLLIATLAGTGILAWPLADAAGMAAGAARDAELEARQSQTKPRSSTEKVQQLASDPLNATYRVQGRNITLRNGRSEIRYSRHSAAKIETAVLGNPVPGDFDADGDRDAALFLVHDSGGSGTFYYVAVAINEHGQYRGTHAVLLGDRIVPKDIVIRDGAVEVNYFDRPADAPMHSRPSVEKQSYLMLEGSVLRVVGGRHDLILVDTPAPGDTVASPLKVKGKARGPWYFEGDFPLRLEDRNGNVIARGYATATDPWMTKEFVPFEGTLAFTKPAKEDSGILILEKDNPSSRRELDDELRIPVFFE